MLGCGEVRRIGLEITFCTVISFFCCNEAEAKAYNADIERDSVVAAFDLQYLLDQVVDIDGAEVDVEELTLLLEGYRSRSLLLNFANRERLEQFPLFSLFQVVSILDYRDKYGDIYSKGELILIDGFNEEFVEKILPLLSFATTENSFMEKSSYRSFKFELLQRWGRRLSADKVEFGSSQYLRFKGSYRDKVSVGLTFDKDRGESYFAKGRFPIPDFISGHIALKEVKFVDNLVIGDFSVRFGQGLVVWSNGSFLSSNTPSTLFKREFGVTPYSGSNEFTFFRGVAASLSFKGVKASAFASVRRLDAKIEGDRYISIYKDGYHNSVDKLRYKGALKEYSAGANISYSFNRFKVGLSTIFYSYNKLSGVAVREDNKFQIYNGVWGNLGLDFQWILKHNIRVFGEVAADIKLAFAALIGAVWSPSYNFEVGFLLRDYSKEYIATHASPIGRNSRAANERAISLSCKYRPISRVVLSGSLEMVKFPWLKYGVKRPSSAIYYSLQGSFLYNTVNEVSLKYGGYFKDYDAIFKNTFRVNYKYKIFKNIFMVSRAEFNLSFKAIEDMGVMPFFGYAFYQELLYNSKFVRLSARVTYYSCRDWNSRIYIYERGMPYSFSAPVLYGKGFKAYLVVCLKPFRNLDIWSKVSNSDIKVEVKYRF